MSKRAVNFEVLLSLGAEQDLEAIYDYICQADSEHSANYVLDQLIEVVDGLSKFPERGSYPKELLELGIKDFRQTFFKPYRVIYRVSEAKVVYLVVDGRRDLQTMLSQRLLRG
jgi:toxin ParE1/3/4